MKRLFPLSLLALLSMAICSSVTCAATKAETLQQLKARTQAIQSQIDGLMAHPHQLGANPRNDAPPQEVSAYQPDNDAYHQGIISYLGGTPVLSSPYLGIRNEFDASNLIINFSSIGHDLRLLKARQKLINTLIDQGDPIPKAPVLDLSGAIEFEASIDEPYMGNTTADLDLSRLQIDIAAMVNPWTSAIIVIDYDSSTLSPNRIGNSNLAVTQGLLTIGDLNTSPYYLTLGQYFVNFGRYSSFQVSRTLVSSMARIRARAATLGYHNAEGLQLSAFVFPGAASGGNSRAAAGIDIDYQFDVNAVGVDVGASVVSNLAEGNAIQNSSAQTVMVPSLAGPAILQPSFTGLAAADTTQIMQHRVPGLNLRAKASLAPFSALVEYVTALRDFSPLDLTYNGEAARLAAVNAEVAYHFRLGAHVPASIAASYQHTYDALAIDLPRARYSISLTANPMKNTTLGIEYRHDKAYHSGDTGTGAGRSVALTTLTGQSRNVFSVFFGVYF